MVGVGLGFRMHLGISLCALVVCLGLEITLEMFSVCWDWVEDWAIHLGGMLSMLGLGRHSFLIFCWYDGHGLGIGHSF